MRGFFAFFLVGCYAPSPPEGAPCAANGACPEPLVCSAGQCRRTALLEDVFTCRPIEAGAGKVTVPRMTAVIDGDLAEWTSCFLPLDPTKHITRDIDGSARFLSGRFSVAHDDTQLYIAAEVEGIAPLGDQPRPSVWKNNSISLYVDGDGSFTAMQYDADAVQIVIDHANRVQAFRNGTVITVPGVYSATKVNGTKFTIEVALRPTTFGRTAFASTMGFDVGFEGGDGMMQYSEVYWFQACGLPACGCPTAGVAAPYCDAREFGRAQLAP